MHNVEEVPNHELLLSYLTQKHSELVYSLNELGHEEREIQTHVIRAIQLIDVRQLIKGLTTAHVQFLLDLLSDDQPDPISLFREGFLTYEENACCLCCEKPCGVVHILAACPQSLQKGRFYKRHDDVTEIMKEAMEEALTPSSDWCVNISKNLEEHLIAEHITSLRLLKRPNLHAVNEQRKEIILVKVTVPWVKNMARQHIDKTERYKELIDDIQSHGYDVSFYAFEISYEGLPTALISDFLLDLGLTKERSLSYLYRMGSKAVEGSMEIWNYWAVREAQTHPQVAEKVLKYDQESRFNFFENVALDSHREERARFAE